MRTKVNKVTVMHSSSYRSRAIMELNSLNFICVCMSDFVMSSESEVCVGVWKLYFSIEVAIPNVTCS